MKKPATVSSNEPFQEIAIDSRVSNFTPKANQAAPSLEQWFADCTQLYEFLDSAQIVFANSSADSTAVTTYLTDYDALCDAVMNDDSDEAKDLLHRVSAGCIAIVERLRGGSIELVFLS